MEENNLYLIIFLIIYLLAPPLPLCDLNGNFRVVSTPGKLSANEFP